MRRDNQTNAPEDRPGKPSAPPARGRMVAAALTLAALLVGGASAASARPMHPDEQPVPAIPNKALHDYNFHLYIDSDRANRVIYYIPKSGYVSVDAPFTTDPRPRFSVNHRVLARGYFEGEVLSYIGGSVSTNGAIAALKMLERDAGAYGYRVAPAPVEEVATRWLLAGGRSVVQDKDGLFRVDVKCERVNAGTRPNGTPIMVDECKAKSDPDGTAYDLGLELMYRFVALPYRGSTIGGSIPFQGVTMPGWDTTIDEKLASGDSWDNLIQSAVDWKLKGDSRTHKAVLHVNWQSLFEQASAFAALHIGGCIDVEVEAFFQKIALCSGTPEKCGVRIEWFDANGRPTPVPSNNAEFVNAVTALQKELQDELFLQVAPDSSVLGRVRRDTSAFFTLRANYEKRILERNERREFYWNPGQKEITAQTTLNIECVQGTAGSRLFWAESQYCKDLLGLAAATPPPAP